MHHDTHLVCCCYCSHLPAWHACISFCGFNVQCIPLDHVFEDLGSASGLLGGCGAIEGGISLGSRLMMMAGDALRITILPHFPSFLIPVPLRCKDVSNPTFQSCLLPFLLSHGGRYSLKPWVQVDPSSTELLLVRCLVTVKRKWNNTNVLKALDILWPWGSHVSMKDGRTEGQEPVFSDSLDAICAVLQASADHRWRDGPVVKNIRCYSRGPKFYPLHPCWVAHNHLWLQLQKIHCHHLAFMSTYTCMHITHS